MKKILLFCAILPLITPANAQSVDLKSLLTQGINENNTATYNEAFSELDSNKDGALSERELLKFQQKGLSEGKDNTHKIFDTDNNGKVTKKEYISFYKKQSLKNMSETELSQIFKNIDTNKNGWLSADELQNFRINNLERQNREIFGIMDLNGDGSLSKEEFGDFMSFAGSILGN